MTFQPVLPVGGLSGWRFLKQTAEVQKETLSNSGSVKREIDYFKAHIADIKTADALVSDRVLLKVALGAFGLDADIDNKFFVKKVLEDGSVFQDALANKLSDKRYLELARTFGFGDPGLSQVRKPGFADNLVERYKDRTFETSVGEQDENMRLALGVERDLGALAARNVSNDTKWFTIMGTPPLRAVFEKAFGLPVSFATLPIDNQLETLKVRSDAIFGSDDVSQFSDSQKQEDLIRQFLLRAQIDNGPSVSGGSIALTILQSSSFSPSVL